MAETFLIGQNGSSGSSSVNLMDFYDMDKWEWYSLNIGNLSTPISKTIVKVANTPGYLIGVAFSDGNDGLARDIISYDVSINNKKILNTTCYGNGNGAYMSGIITTPFMTKNHGNSAPDAFLGICSVNQNYDVPYLGLQATTIVQNQLLVAMAPIPFTSLEINFKSTLGSFSSRYQFICLYVTKKS